jgi:hypothetical protein
VCSSDLGAAQGLARTLRSMVSPTVPGPVVFAGSVLTQHRGFCDRVAAQVVNVLPQAGSYLLTADGTVGAVMQALRAVGVELTQQLFERISESLTALSEHPVR